MKNSKRIKVLAAGLAFLYAFFFLLFAFDSFEDGLSLKSLSVFFIHSLPSIIIFTAALTGLKRQVLSATLFFLIFILTIWFFDTNKSTETFLIVSLPAVVIANLFLLAYYIETRESPKT